MGEIVGLSDEWYFDDNGKLRWTKQRFSLLHENVARFFAIDVIFVKLLFYPWNTFNYDDNVLEDLIKGANKLSGGATMQEVQNNLKLFLRANNIEV